MSSDCPAIASGRMRDCDECPQCVFMSWTNPPQERIPNRIVASGLLLLAAGLLEHLADKISSSKR